jgi:hypothetical protein
MTSIFRLQERLALLIGKGKSLEEVEQQVIEPADISAEQKAALWLYAWSTFHGSPPYNVKRGGLSETYSG